MTLIAASIAPSGNASAVRLLKSISAPLVELRLDGMRHPDVEALVRLRRRGLIVAVRARSEGGIVPHSRSERSQLLRRAAAAGAEYIDVGLVDGTGAIRSIRRDFPAVTMIVSHHDFRKTPSDPARIYARLRSERPDILKMAFMARSLSDAGRVWNFLASRRDPMPRAVLSMGPYGLPLRILQGAGGGSLTYGSVEEATAPGQPAYRDLERLYRAGRINRATEIFGLLGNPVSTSKGVEIHNRLFRRLLIDAVYVNFLSDSAAEFFRHFGKSCRGISVTMPFKRSALRYCSRLDRSAARTGAVNTIIRSGSSHSGFNTDYSAILELASRHLKRTGSSVIIIGSGGFAAAAGAAAASVGASVVLTGRNLRRVRQTADKFGWETCPMSDLRIRAADLLVHATPAGMPGVSTAGLEDAGLYRRNVLRKFSVVYDAVYGSGTTRLIRTAERAGCTTIDGSRHFLTQARLQNSLFVGACRPRKAGKAG